MTMPLRTIWTLCATDLWDERYIRDAMNRAADEGVSGIELCNRAVDQFIAYRDFPALAATVDREVLARDQRLLQVIGEEAARLNLRLGLWHHEVHGPEQLLELLPPLRAADGLIDLEIPLLYEFMRGKCREFFDLFPHVAELVLTLTETRFVVAHRPFTDLPPVERLRRVLQAVADVTEAAGKWLVIRPFSALRADELHVREAVNQLRAARVSLMYKTEPFDWNPFLPDEPLIGSVPRYEARAETDAGAEYYGQNEFPVCNPRYLQRRLEAARQKGARVAVIRVDRGATHTALGHPLNEGNVIAATRWARQPDRPVAEHWLDWFAARYRERPPALLELFEQTFAAIQHALYINGQSLSHHAFPSPVHAKHIQVYSLFEEGISLAHLTEHWSILPERRTLTHGAIIAEKEHARDLARQIREQFAELGAALPPASRQALAATLPRLELLAESFLAFCRVVLAHLEEMGEGRARTVGGFDEESARLIELADRLESECGAAYFRDMPMQMRETVTELTAERAREIPLRRALAADPNLVDCVLCGFASEGHRLAKRLHCGQTFPFADRWVRATGIGPAEGFSYELASLPNQPQQLIVTVAGNGPPAPGRLRIGDQEFPLEPNAGRQLASGVDPAGSPAAPGVHDCAFPLSPSPEPRRRVWLWSTSSLPCWIATIRLVKSL